MVSLLAKLLLIALGYLDENFLAVLAWCRVPVVRVSLFYLLRCFELCSWKFYDFLSVTFKICNIFKLVNFAIGTSRSEIEILPKKLIIH